MEALEINNGKSKTSFYSWIRLASLS